MNRSARNSDNRWSERFATTASAKQVFGEPIEAQRQDRSFLSRSVTVSAWREVAAAENKKAPRSIDRVAAGGGGGGGW